MEALATLQGEDERLLVDALRFGRANAQLSSAALHGHLAAEPDAQSRVATLSSFEFLWAVEAHRVEFRDGIDALLNAALVGIPRREALSRLREEDDKEQRTRALRDYLALRTPGAMSISQAFSVKASILACSRLSTVLRYLRSTTFRKERRFSI